MPGRLASLRPGNGNGNSSNENTGVNKVHPPCSARPESPSPDSFARSSFPEFQKEAPPEDFRLFSTPWALDRENRRRKCPLQPPVQHRFRLRLFSGHRRDLPCQLHPGPVPFPGVVAPGPRLPPEGIAPVRDISAVVQGLLNKGIHRLVRIVPL